MEKGRSDSRKYYLKQNNEELIEPFSFIREFFNEDWLEGHLESLARWRKYVIGTGYYAHRDDGPAGLLYFYRLNIKLVEAAYMLSQEKRSIQCAKRIAINFEQRLHHEKLTWLNCPVSLSEQEWANPYLTIERFFKVFTIDQYLQFLKLWVETGLSPEPINETMEISEIIYFYEQMQKLYETCWVIRQREFEPILKRSAADEHAEVTALVKKNPKELPLVRINCSFNERLTAIEKTALDQLTELIRKEISAVLMIVHLGTHPAPATFYLLVVTDEKEKTTEHELVNRIESMCKPLINVCAIVHKSDAFIGGLQDNNRFFYNCLEKHKIAYRSATLIIPALKEIETATLLSQLEFYWNRWGLQGKNFIDTALSAFDDGNYNLSLFLMHQAAESSLSVIVRIVLGYRLSIHNLARMLRLTMIFTDDLRSIFDVNDIENVQLFELLQNAYSAARYKDDFNPDSESIKMLSDKVCKLFITAEMIYSQVISTLKEQNG